MRVAFPQVSWIPQMLLVDDISCPHQTDLKLMNNKLEIVKIILNLDITSKCVDELIYFEHDLQGKRQ
jgi:hypothetical protein